jgi:hypothetical protein
MTAKDEEIFRLQKHMTHLNRYTILQERMSEFIDYIKQKGDVEPEDTMEWEGLIGEQVEVLSDLFVDAQEEIKILRKGYQFVSVALRYYTKEYGNHLTTKRLPEESFITTVTILPLENDLIDVDIKIHKFEEDKL